MLLGALSVRLLAKCRTTVNLTRRRRFFKVAEEKVHLSQTIKDSLEQETCFGEDLFNAKLNSTVLDVSKTKVSFADAGVELKKKSAAPSSTASTTSSQKRKRQRKQKQRNPKSQGVTLAAKSSDGAATTPAASPKPGFKKPYKGKGRGKSSGGNP